MKKSYANLMAMGLAVAVIAFAGNAETRVVGPCADCHTMHNSQDGAPDALNPTGPRGALVKGGCAGCHSSDGTARRGTDNNIPVVWRTSTPTDTILAGGDFFYLFDEDTTFGHNVTSIPGMALDGNLSKTPPGFVANRAPEGGTAVGVDWEASAGLTCAGTYGCHGNHAADTDDFKAVSGAHHEGGAIDGSTVGKSYRFLLGVTGVEDSDWEATKGAADHNIYKAVARANDTAMDTSTISYLCGECHGNFHAGAGEVASNNTDWTSSGGTPWYRHPTDFDLSDATVRAGGDDYQGYAYSVLAPVGTADPAAALAAGSDAYFDASAAGKAVVTCLSCHRAHGSPYPDSLRWSYGSCDAGSDDAACGCFVCHTAKDAG